MATAIMAVATAARRRVKLWHLAGAAAMGMAAVALALLLFGRGSGQPSLPRSTASLPTSSPTPTVSPSDLSPSPVATAGKQADGHPALRARAGIPETLVIPRLHVDAPVLRIEMGTNPNDRHYRTLVPPPDPADVGWWKDGPQPGAGRGSALIVGHTKKIPGVEGVGDGALGHISRLHIGDRIDLATSSGRLHYRVTSVVPAKPYGEVARDAARIDDRNYPGGRIVLITCWYDGSRFIGNTLVFAIPQ